MGVASELGYMLALLVVGAGARRWGVLGARRRHALNRVAFVVALPALVFTSTYTQPLGEIVSVPLLAGYWAVMAAMVGASWLVHRSRAPASTRSVAMVQSYHCNLGYLGLPIVAAAFGDLAAAKASLLLGVGVLTQTPITLGVLVALNDATTSLRAEVRGFLTNPVILALAGGLAVSQIAVAPPAAAAPALDVTVRGLDLLADLAFPIAAVGVGASLSPDLGGVGRSTLEAVIALKTVVMPVLALVVFSVVGATAATRDVGVVMVGMPTAVATYVYTTELGGDERLASAAVFATTVVSAGTLFVLIALLP